MNAYLKVSPTQISLKTDKYDRDTFEILKSTIPSKKRAYDPDRKTWTIDIDYLDKLKRLLQVHYVIYESLVEDREQTYHGPVNLMYVGVIRERGDGMYSHGLIDNSWNWIFTIDVMKKFFGDVNQNGVYGVLGVKQDIAQVELKSEYRKLLKQWHPDHCQEPDAAAMTRKIMDAYKTIETEEKRTKYDKVREMALHFAGTNNFSDNLGKPIEAERLFIPPRRCGELVIDATLKVGKWNVDRIESWKHIIRGGTMLVTNFNEKTKKVEQTWVEYES